MKIGFYQGCCFQGQDAHMFDTMKKVFGKLGVELVLLEETTCCGGNTIEEEERKLSYAINLRNIAIAESKGLDMLISCNTCYMVIAKAKLAAERNRKLKEEINELLKAEGLSYSGKAKIYHLLDFLRDVIGYEKVKSAVVNPLKGVKVLPYYGCHVLYPKEIAVDDSDNPDSLETLLETLGAEVVKDFPAKDVCCGYHSFYTDKKMTMKKLKRIFDGVENVGSGILATPCPLCFKAFDIYQTKMDNPPNVPSAYLVELMAYAFGLSKKESGLEYHLVKVEI